MKKWLFGIIISLSVASCSIKINQNFDYQKLLNPEQIESDIEDLKKNLIRKHYNIDWEGEKSNIFKALDNIKTTDTNLTIDSFENQIKIIIDNIDDGHSRIIHQDSIKTKHVNQFGYQTISDSIKYLRIGNFLDTKNLIKTLNKLKLDFQNNESEILIIDIRSNSGGSIPNVNHALSYFVPSNTKIYENVDIKNTSKFTSFLSSKLNSWKENLNIYKYTIKKKLNKDPIIYLWVNDRIASASLLFTYHLQNNGVFIIGKPPKGIFNTFGNQYGHQLKYSKIIYTLATAKVNISNEQPKKINDMLKPNYIPESDWRISDLLNFITNHEKDTIDNNR